MTCVMACVGWEGVDVRVRDVWVSIVEGFRVGAGLGPDSNETDGGVWDDLALGL